MVLRFDGEGLFECFERSLVVVNGQPGRILRDARGVWDVLAIDVVDGRIGAVRIVRNPDKLAHV